MNRLHRALVHLVPAPRSEWIRAHEAELDHIEGRWPRWRWNLGLLPLAASALVRQIRHDPRSFLGGALMKTIVVTLSALNFVAGVGLLAILLLEPGAPMIAVALGGALLVQSCFTLALVLGAFGRHQHAARHVQLTGSTLALVVGGVGFVVGFLANINPAGNDPEYGPMAIAFLLAAHGMASLVAFTSPRPTEPQTSTL